MKKDSVEKGDVETLRQLVAYIEREVKEIGENNPPHVAKTILTLYSLKEEIESGLPDDVPLDKVRQVLLAVIEYSYRDCIGKMYDVLGKVGGRALVNEIKEDIIKLMDEEIDRRIAQHFPEHSQEGAKSDTVDKHESTEDSSDDAPDAMYA